MDPSVVGILFIAAIAIYAFRRQIWEATGGLLIFFGLGVGAGAIAYYALDDMPILVQLGGTGLAALVGFSIGRYLTK